MRGVSANEAGDFSGSAPLLEESLELFDRIGDRHYALLSTFHLAWAYDELGDTARAKQMDTDGLRRAREEGNRRMEANFLDAVAGHLIEDGQPDEAWAMLRESLQIYLDIGEITKLPDCFGRVARAMAELPEPEAAVRLIARSLATYKEFGEAVPLYVARRFEKLVPSLRARLAEPAFDAAWQAGAAMTVDEAVALALQQPGEPTG